MSIEQVKRDHERLAECLNLLNLAHESIGMAQNAIAMARQRASTIEDSALRLTVIKAAGEFKADVGSYERV